MTNIITGIILSIILVLFYVRSDLGWFERTHYPATLCSLLISHNSNLDSRKKCVAFLVQCYC
jgi:hypothetical protein